MFSMDAFTANSSRLFAMADYFDANTFDQYTRIETEFMLYDEKVKSRIHMLLGIRKIIIVVN